MRLLGAAAGAIWCSYDPNYVRRYRAEDCIASGYVPFVFQQSTPIHTGQRQSPDQPITVLEEVIMAPTLCVSVCVCSDQWVPLGGSNVDFEI